MHLKDKLLILTLIVPMCNSLEALSNSYFNFKYNIKGDIITKSLKIPARIITIILAALTALSTMTQEEIITYLPEKLKWLARIIPITLILIIAIIEEYRVRRAEEIIIDENVK
jgi:hypothetical protein